VGQSLVETFRYTLSDGVVSTAASSLTIQINGVNDAPIAAPNTNSVTAGSVIRIASSKYDDTIFADTPVAYWRLNESSGTVAANRLAPSTPDGSIFSTSTTAIGYTAAGLLANAPDFGLAFTGTQSITIPDSPLINTYAGNATAKTIELWFNAANVQPRQVIYEQGNTTSGLNLYIDAGQLYFGTWNASVFGPIVRANIASNTTYHVVGVFGASSATLYINGVQVATGATTFSGIAPHAGPTSIGAASTTRFHSAPLTATTGFNFVGTIDEVALYNTALSAAQVGRHYTATGIVSNDTDVDTGDTRSIIKVYGLTATGLGEAMNVNTPFKLPSGALLTVQSDGSYDYDPNGAFDNLSIGATRNDFFAYTIADSNGVESTATVTITVQGRNDAPTGILLSNTRVTLSNVVGTLSTVDKDLGDTHTYAIINQPTNTFAISGSQLVVNNRTGLLLGETRFLTIEATDLAGAKTTQTFELLITEVPSTVGIISTQVTPSSVRFQFNTAMDLSVLNLYDGVDTSVDATDVTIVGATTGAVKGSIVWDAATNALTFIKTGTPLAADSYTATLFSRADGFKSATGELLDGDSNGVAGGNFVTTFGVTTSTARVVSLPDFSRGATSTAGQNVNLSFDNGNPGIPVTISDGAGVLAMDFDITYNPAMLNLSSTFFGVLPAGWSTTVNLISIGRMRLSLSGTTPLPSGPQIVTRLLANVPANTPYGASDLVRIENLNVYTQTGGNTPIPTIADAGLHKAIFVGDTNGDGLYTAQDAGWVAGVVVGSFTGFDAYSWTDPVIVANVNQNAGLDGLDSSWIARKGLSPTLQPEIPNLPAGGLIIPAGIDPTIAADQLVPTRRGATANVPIRITDNAAGLFGVDVFIDYNTNLLDLADGLNVSGVNIAGMFLTEGGWSIDSFVDDTNGKLRIAIYRASPSTSSAGAIANVPFSVKPNAAFGVTPIVVGGNANVPPFTFSFVSGSVNVINSPPTDINLNQNTVLENTSTAAADLLFGQLGTADLDPVDSYIYDLVTGTGDSDNARFRIVDDKIFIKQGETLNFETKPSYTVRVRTTDSGGIAFTKPITLNVTDVNEPVVLTVNNPTVTGNVATTLTNSGTWSDPENGNVVLTATLGTVVKNANGTWSWQYTPTVATTAQTVTITANDGTNTATITFNVTIHTTIATRGMIYANATGASASTAIATDKRALLPGQSSSFANYSNYSRGLNGLVVDIAGLPASVTSAQLAASLQFSRWDGIAAAGFTALPAAAVPTVAIISGGVAGSTRVRITFPDNTLQNTWLRVTVVANSVTGLAANDVFYFGNVIGDLNVGNTTTRIRVNSLDTSAVRSNQSPGANSADILNIYDLNRDGRVNSLDTSVVRNNQQASGIVAPITV
jgi:VCBS repeat-containing protein